MKARNLNYQTIVIKFTISLPVSVLSLMAEALKISNNAKNIFLVLLIRYVYCLIAPYVCSSKKSSKSQDIIR